MMFTFMLFKVISTLFRSQKLKIKKSFSDSLSVYIHDSLQSCFRFCVKLHLYFYVFKVNIVKYSCREILFTFMLALRNHVIESKQFDREFSIQLRSCEKIVALYFEKGIIFSRREKSKF